MKTMVNGESEKIGNKKNCMKDINKKLLIWVGHVCRKEGKMPHRENSSRRKRPLEHPKLRWEERVKEDVEKVKSGEDWEKLSLKKEKLEVNMLDGMVLKSVN